MFCKWFKSRKKKVYVSINNVEDWQDLEINILLEINKIYDANLLPDKNLYKGAKNRTNYFLSLTPPKATHDKLGLVSGLLNSFGITVIGEVIGTNYNTAKAIVYAWRNSPAHHKLLSDKKYKYIGISRVTYKKQSFVCCLLGKTK